MQAPTQHEPSALDRLGSGEAALELVLARARAEAAAALAPEFHALVLPELGAEARRVAGALEERDREDAVRLRRFRRRRGCAPEGAARPVPRRPEGRRARPVACHAPSGCYPYDMKIADAPAPTLQPDLELAGGCLACGGVLSVRLGPGRSRSVCRGCGWWSSPHLVREEDGIHLRHPAAGVA